MYEAAWFLMGFLFGVGAFVSVITKLGRQADG